MQNELKGDEWPDLLSTHKPSSNQTSSAPNGFWSNKPAPQTLKIFDDSPKPSCPETNPIPLTEEDIPEEKPTQYRILAKREPSREVSDGPKSDSPNSAQNFTKEEDLLTKQQRYEEARKRIFQDQNVNVVERTPKKSSEECLQVEKVGKRTSNVSRHIEGGVNNLNLAEKEKMYQQARKKIFSDSNPSHVSTNAKSRSPQNNNRSKPRGKAK